jgi:two-component system response regulator HupR/HoxA
LTVEKPNEGRPDEILIVDDEEAILESLEFTLRDEYTVYTASTGSAGLELLEAHPVAVVIVDQVMRGGLSGVDFLAKAIALRPATVRMMLTGYADEKAMMRAINDGHIYRFIKKPWEPDELRLEVKRAVERYRLELENVALNQQLADANEKLRAENLVLRRQAQRQYAFENIIGSSPSMERVFDVMEKVAQTDATVLIAGETGTGKDLVAHAIHYTGPRREERFVAQNCGALPDTLLESELFGHKRGAFTGAHADKMGLFEFADGGTIFLDEIGETEPGMQVRLLRVLQDGEIRPLGSSETRRVDVRIIAATNRDLRQAVAEGRFREDLFYRLRVVEIGIPPLRERREDVPALAHHFLDQVTEKMGRTMKGFTNAAMDLLTRYEWSGNVRELENEIERAVALAGSEEVIQPDMFSEELRDSSSRPSEPASGGITTEERDMNRAVDILKRTMIRQAIEETGSKSQAAARLGIPRQSLQKMMKRLAMD